MKELKHYEKYHYSRLLKRNYTKTDARKLAPQLAREAKLRTGVK
jgi:hypothetical protein